LGVGSLREIESIDDGTKGDLERTKSHKRMEPLGLKKRNLMKSGIEKRTWVPSHKVGTVRVPISFIGTKGSQEN
jgi:hypothetical protein